MKDNTARVRSLPTIASVRSAVATQGAVMETLRLAGPSYGSVDALLESGVRHAAVMLYPTDAAQAHEWVIRLRRTPEYALSVLCLSHSCGDAIDTLADEIAGKPAHIYERVRAIQERRNLLSGRQPIEDDERLLAFLYTRPERVVTPSLDWQSPQAYRYPLLDAFAPAGLSSEQWLVALRRRGLLEPVELVDRLRQCSACSSAHLNYVDVCPQCASIDIAESIFLHCHTCGHVDRQDAFAINSGLSCAKCLSRLRHIGVDYDRALEAFSCFRCNGRFTEPDVKANCLQCRTSQRTEELVERRIETYRLSEAGQLAARTGRMDELFALIDESNCVHPAYFEQTLDFLLSLGRRHPEVEFGLVCLRLGNLRELLIELSRVQITQMIDGFALRLRELVRTTDLVMRSDDEHCWLLLPQTPPEGLQTLLTRLQNIPNAIEHASSARLAIASAAIASRTLGERKVDAKLLMAELRSRIS